MPDDYPRDAWSPEATAANVLAWDEIIHDYDVAESAALNPKSFADILRKEQAKSKDFEQYAYLEPMSYEGVQIDDQIEYVQRKQVREVLSLASSEDDILAVLEAHLHFGNRKLPENYLIWNLNPAHMCPSLLNARGDRFDYTTGELPDADESFCQAFNNKGKLICYAWGAELGYRDCFPYRVRQNELWHRLIKKDPEWMVAVVKRIHAKKIKTDTPIVAFRWSEAGDLEDQESLDAAMYISSALRSLSVPKRITTVLKNDHELPGTGRRDARGKWIKGTGKIIPAGEHSAKWRPGEFTSYLYSARQDLDFEEAPENGLVVLGSDWQAPGIVGQFKMVDSPEDAPHPKGDQWQMCPMKCRICQRCPMGLSSRVLNH